MSEDDSGRRRPVLDATAEDWLGSNRDPDVLLSVPDLGVDKINLTVEDLRADVDLHARVLDIVELHVGAQVTLGKVDLNIENVRAQAMLKVKLDKVAEIVERVMQTIDNNPEIITSLTAPIGRGVEQVGVGAREGVRAIGERPTRPAAGPAEIETVHAVDYDEVAEPAPQVPRAPVERVRTDDRTLAAAPPASGAIETVHLDGQWWNRIEATDEIAGGPFSTKDDAIKDGRKRASRAQVAHIIRNKDGRISGRRGYESPEA